MPTVTLNRARAIPFVVDLRTGQQKVYDFVRDNPNASVKQSLQRLRGLYLSQATIKSYLYTARIMTPKGRAARAAKYTVLA